MKPTRWEHEFFTVGGRGVPLDPDHLNALAAEGWEVVAILPHIDMATGQAVTPSSMVVVAKRMSPLTPEDTVPVKRDILDRLLATLLDTRAAGQYEDLVAELRTVVDG